MIVKMTCSIMLSIFVLCFAKAIGFGLSESVQFTSNPSEYIIGLTPNIDLQCSFQRENSPPSLYVMSILISLYNATDQTFSGYVASINGMDGHAHNLSYDVNGISGVIDNSGLSFLKISLREPPHVKGGEFKCEVSGFDAVGLPFTLSNTTRLKVVTSDLSGLVNDLQVIKHRLGALRDFAIDLQSRLSSIRRTFFYPSRAYNGHQYYMAVDMDHFIYSEAQAFCELQGGYLVELDNAEEFVFVLDIIRPLSGFDRNYIQVMTGSTDEDQEGVWINKHSAVINANFDWAPGSPAQDRDRNCQSFSMVSSRWYLVDSSCDFLSDSKRNSFICEVPEDMEMDALS